MKEAADFRSKTRDTLRSVERRTGTLLFATVFVLCLSATVYAVASEGSQPLSKENVIQLLSNENVLKDIDCGPTTIIMSSENKKMLIRIAKDGNAITVTTGKLVKHTMRISMEELEQYK